MKNLVLIAFSTLNMISKISTQASERHEICLNIMRFLKKNVGVWGILESHFQAFLFNAGQLEIYNFYNR